MQARATAVNEFAKTLLRCGPVYAPDGAALSLRREVDGRSRVEVFDYANSAEPFTRAYGIRNALKCFAAVEASGIEVGEGARVCDLGCGSGAFSVAFSQAAGCADLLLCGFDASASQLDLARRAVALAEVPGSHVFLEGALPRSLPIIADITISSFWFCENRDVYRDPGQMDGLVPKRLLVVDYLEVIEEMRSALAGQFETVKAQSLAVDVPDVLVGLVGQGSVTAHFALFQRPSSSRTH